MALWNRIGKICHPRGTSVDIWSDASGLFGCGALCPTLLRWFQLEWTRTKVVSGVEEDHSNTWIELLPNVLSSVVWGAVAVVSQQSVQHHAPVALLVFIRAHYEFSVQVEQVQGEKNAISQNNTTLLHSQAFQESYQNDPIPEDPLALVIKEQPDWTSLTGASELVRHVRYLPDQKSKENQRVYYSNASARQIIICAYGFNFLRCDPMKRWIVLLRLALVLVMILL